MEEKIQELQDKLDALEMRYCSQVSLWKGLYYELKAKTQGEDANELTKQIDNRQDANRQIMVKLFDLIEKYPHQRFGQLIANYIFPDYRERDIFFEESCETLNKLNK